MINWDKFMSIPRESGLSQEARDLIFSLCTRFFLMLCPLNFYHCRPHRIIKFVNINLFHVGFGSAFLFQFFYFFFAITLPFQRWSKNRKEWLGRHQVPSFLCKHWLQLGSQNKAGSIQANHQVRKSVFHPLNLWFLLHIFSCNSSTLHLIFRYETDTSNFDPIDPDKLRPENEER